MSALALEEPTEACLCREERDWLARKERELWERQETMYAREMDRWQDERAGTSLTCTYLPACLLSCHLV